jgi:hypothetical protein
VEASANLRAENEALEADQSVRGELQLRMGDPARETLHIADTLSAAKRAAAGLIAMKTSSFSAEGRPELGMIVYNPASMADADRLRHLLATRNG